MSNYKNENDSRSLCEDLKIPELGQILDKLQRAVNAYDELVGETNFKLQLIKKVEIVDSSRDLTKSPQPESVTEEIRLLIDRFENLNDRSKFNLNHLSEIV